MRLSLSALSFLLTAVPLGAQTPKDQPGQEAGQEPAPTSAPAAAAPAPPRPALGVGDALPPVVIEELAQTKAQAFSDFYGRPVLIEFFAYWCGPCALSVKHLNELQKAYGPRGLAVVAVTTESMKKTQPWIEKNGAEYAYGHDPKGELHRLFQIQNIPSAVLVDSFGMVQWVGNPRGIKGEQLEGLLADALPHPVWEWPEAARPLAGMLAKGEYATALQEAAKVPAADGLDFTALVHGRITPMVTRFEDLVTRANYGKALALGDRLEKGLATLPEGEKVTARLKELRADPVITRQVADEARIFELENRCTTLRKAAEAQALRTEVAAFLDTKPKEEIERRAKIVLETLDRGLAKAGKGKGDKKSE